MEWLKYLMSKISKFYHHPKWWLALNQHRQKHCSKPLAMEHSMFEISYTLHIPKTPRFIVIFNFAELNLYHSPSPPHDPPLIPLPHPRHEFERMK